MKTENKKMKCKVCKDKTIDRKSEFFPFCSARCRDVDLGKWFAGEYFIKGQKVSSDQLDDEV